MIGSNISSQARSYLRLQISIRYQEYEREKKTGGQQYNKVVIVLQSISKVNFFLLHHKK